MTPPYDTDGNPASFSTTELANIVAIWRSVAEDYAAFDVDVTTEEPLDQLTIGSRAAIGGSSYDWYGAGAGGVAYVVSWGLAGGVAYVVSWGLAGGVAYVVSWGLAGGVRELGGWHMW